MQYICDQLIVIDVMKISKCYEWSCPIGNLINDINNLTYKLSYPV